MPGRRCRLCPEGPVVDRLRRPDWEDARDCGRAARLVAALLQPRAVDRAHRTARPRARHGVHAVLPHRPAQLHPVPRHPRPAEARGAGLGLPADPGHPRHHRHRLHPAGDHQALVGLPQHVPLAPGPVGEAAARAAQPGPAHLRHPGAAGHRLPQPARLATLRLGLRGRALRAGVRGHRLGAAARGDQAARHPLRVVDPAGRGRRAHRGAVAGEPGLAQQRRTATTAAHHRDLPPRGAARDRDRDRCRGDHQRRPDRHPAGAGRVCWLSASPAEDRRECLSAGPPRRPA